MDPKKYLLALFLLIGGCTSAPPPPNRLDSTDSTLAEAAYSVSQSINTLAASEQAEHPLPQYQEPPDPSTYGMGMKVSVDWSGPLEPILKEVAAAANYHVRVLGTAPAIPVSVNIVAHMVPIADVVQDIGFQSGKRAQITVMPISRTIELHYAAP